MRMKPVFVVFVFRPWTGTIPMSATLLGIYHLVPY